MMSDKQALIWDWLRVTNQAADALSNWRAYLKAWEAYPNEIDDSLFMGVVQDMAEAGLLEWLDGSEAGLDRLREVLTGGER